MRSVNQYVQMLSRDIEAEFSKDLFLITGHPNIDNFFRGLVCSQVMLIFGAPKAGKTSLLLAFTYLNIQSNACLCYVPGKEAPYDLTLRLASIHTGWPTRKIVTADIHDHEWGQLYETFKTISEWSLYFEDSVHFSIEQWIDNYGKSKSAISKLFIDNIDRLIPLEDIPCFLASLKHYAENNGLQIICSLGDSCFTGEIGKSLKKELIKIANANDYMLAELQSTNAHGSAECSFSAMNDSQRIEKHYQFDLQTAYFYK